jgi:type VI secretion system secreted protein VgrG
VNARLRDKITGLIDPKGDKILNDLFKQANRLAQLSTVLGENVLVLLRFEGTDYMNDLFCYQVEALSTDPDIDLGELIGTHATVSYETRAHGVRYFDGIVTDAEWAGPGETGVRYNLTLRPWFWLAGKRRNQRIFHEMTVVQILTELLQAYSGLGSPALEDRLLNSYPNLEYTVQYRESDLAFACRLMERFGINYHFTHADGDHTMVLTDSADAHDFVEGHKRPYYGASGDSVTDEERFWLWTPQRNLTTGALRLTDYNFKMPRASMEVDRVGDATYAQGDIESFDYPGDYLHQERGKKVLSLRLDQERSQDRFHRAAGDVASLSAGMHIELSGDALPGEAQGSFLCLQAQHRYKSDSYGTGGTGGDKDPFIGHYLFVPADAPIVPQRKTPAAVVLGPQTAAVVGEGEIDCDEYGRILVKFHWDIANAFSMRCRVSQNWAGQGWGGMIIPRIGMEVVVEFLEGDPDKPLVTGCVYNAKSMPPYALPQNKTMSVFKSQTHQGGGFNEISFEDQVKQERIFIHAQRNHDTVVEVNRNSNIGVTDTETVGADQIRTIGKDEIVTIGSNSMLTVGKDVVHSIARNVTTTTAGQVEYTVGGSQISTYGANLQETMGANLSTEIGANHIVTIGRNAEETVNGKKTVTAGESVTIDTGTFTVTAFKEIVLKAMGGSITIGPAGVKIEAMQIKLNGMTAMSMGMPAQVASLALAAKEDKPLVEPCPPP